MEKSKRLVDAKIGVYDILKGLDLETIECPNF